MTLIRHSHRAYLDLDDLEGVCNVLAKRMAEIPNDKEHDCEFAQLDGAYTALYILLTTSTLNTQRDFMTVFDQMTGATKNEENQLD